MSAVRRVAGSLLLALGALAASLAAAEWIVLPRVLGLPRAAFLLGFVADAERVGGVPINAMGFTGDVPAPHKPPGTLRVLTLGGSPLFNRGMTARLRAALRDASEAPVEVLGAALRGHTTWSSVLKYRHLSRLDLDFDLVLVYHGINDLFANHVAPRDFRADYSHLRAWYRRGWLLSNSVIARLVYNRWLHRTPRGVLEASAFRSARVFQANLVRLVEAVRADGGTPVLVTFAWHIPADYTRERFEAGALGYVNPERYDPRAVEYWGPVPFVRQGLLVHNITMHRVASEHGVPLLDAERALSSDVRNFGDVCHFSERGTDAFVALVVAFLSERGLLDGPLSGP